MKEKNLGEWTFGRFCSWLCGFGSKELCASEARISKNLPLGISIRDATADELGEASKAAIVASRQQTKTIIKFVFSQLNGDEERKAEAMVRTILPVIPSEAITGFVQTAARARPSLALTVARAASAMVPEQSEGIATALQSVVAGATYDLAGPIAAGKAHQLESS